MIELQPLEIASGYVFGAGNAAALPSPKLTPKEAFENAVLQALRRPPTVVAFSGGRDSSAVLAVAATLARREGLAPPIAATLRFPESAESDETAWQERVVRHVGLDEWIRIEVTDELDCVGPYATEALRRHGLLWPANAHVLMPMLELAHEGSLLTGDGGDLVLDASPWSERVLDVLARRARPTPRDALRVAWLLAPKVVRARRLRRRYPEPIRAPWLRQDAFTELLYAWSLEAASEPVRLDARIPWSRRRRAVDVALASFETLAAGASVQLVHPFNAPEFVEALADVAAQFRYADRSDAMQLLFSDVLPEDVCMRTTKGGFRDVFWNRHARAFAAEWDGEGADATLVDVPALRNLWLSPQAREHFRSCTQLQAAWLARHTESAERSTQRVEQPTGAFRD